MKRYALIISVFGFFVLAGVGCLNDVPPMACAIRAVIGAVGLFIMVQVAGKIILGILVEAIVRGHSAAGPGRSRGGNP